MLQVKHNAYTGLFSLCMNPLWDHLHLCKWSLYGTIYTYEISSK